MPKIFKQMIGRLAAIMKQRFFAVTCKYHSSNCSYSSCSQSSSNKIDTRVMTLVALIILIKVLEIVHAHAQQFHRGRKCQSAGQAPPCSSSFYYSSSSPTAFPASSSCSSICSCLRAFNELAEVGQYVSFLATHQWTKWRLKLAMS